MGIRDWPSTVLTDRLDETCSDGALRYVLEGAGEVSCAGQTLQVQPNDLVRVNGDGQALSWSCAEGCAEMVILTPEYNGPPLLPVVAGFLVACVALITATASGS